MAKATVQYKEVVSPIEKVTLEMNPSEAMTLLAILSRVSGCPTYSPRKHADKLYTILKDAVNLDYYVLKQTEEFKSLDASKKKGFINKIIFDDYKG